MLYLKKDIKSTTFAIWKIDESKEELLSMLDHQEWIMDILSIRSDKIAIEKLAIRVLIKELLGEEKKIYYRSSGRPYLDDKSYNISMSHTKGYVAIALDRDCEVGVDIEQITEKIKRIRSRVVSDKEYINPAKELVHLLLHWSAKEAIFKTLDTEGVDYLKHLCIQPFEPQGKGFFTGSETKTYPAKEFEIYYQIEDEFVLTCLTVNPQ